MYNILEARIEYKNGQPNRICVLVEISENDVRAIVATTKPLSGYMFIPRAAKINDELLQNVARAGIETVDIDKFFPNWKANYSKGE